MQIKNGLASVVQTSATVTGSGTTWLADVSIGDYFIKAGDALPIVYTVGGIVSDTQLTLTAPYGGPTESSIAYVVHRDFFPNGNAQLFSTDVETAGIFNESAKNSVLSDELGTAAFADLTISPTDTTVGAPTKVGDFGIGGGVVLTETDLGAGTYLVSGIYITPSSGVTDIPIGFTQTNMLIIFVEGNEGARKQTLVERATDRMWLRVGNAGGTGYGLWNELYTTANILGTVSESAGVPTGAIIESYFSGNTWVVKYADGQMIMFTTVTIGVSTTAIGNVFQSAVVNWVYPESFVGLVIGSVNSGTSQGWADTTTVNVTQLSYQRWSSNSHAVNITGYLLVIGRWF